jgi:hypothetical protein
MKRTKRTKKRSGSRKTMSAMPRRKRMSLGRRRKRSKSRLSEMFTPETARAGASVIVSGALGGAIAGGVHKVIANQNNLVRYAIEGGAAFLTYALLGKPNMAAGMSGAFASIEMQGIYNTFLNEGNYADPGAINQMPMFLNESGDPLTLMEDNGTTYFLNEATGETTPTSDIYLNENDIYPEYGANTNLY